MENKAEHRLLNALEHIQQTQGAVSDEVLKALAEEWGQPLYRLEGLRSFYPVFRETAGAPNRLQICRDGPCRLKDEGAAEALKAALNDREDIEIEMVSCLGLCDCAPAAALNDSPGPLPDRAAVDAWLDGSSEISEDSHLKNLKDRHLPTDPYPDAAARYSASAQWLKRPAEDIIAEIDAAGLQGLGGAAFPTARKWQFTRAAP
ncbi:MAG: NAD(P)H-dependent oxidoreductase subunit E, partial [Gammaproteobacteria bacterium]|nr:NAD(P)H-dependent oxidoreductase subunit E [Gammaproteobacteria bacterium]